MNDSDFPASDTNERDAREAKDTAAAEAGSAPQSPPTGGSEGGEGGEGATPPLPAPPPSPPSPAPVATDGSGHGAHVHGDEVYRPAPLTNPVVEALVAGNLYLRAAGANEHRVVCPWADEHLPNETGEAIYLAPTDHVPQGAFHCPCTHKKPHLIWSLLDHLQVDRSEARCKPLIRVILGETHRVVAAAEQVLAARGGFYRSNGVIAMVKTDPRTGDVTTEPVSEHTLGLHLSAGSDWEKYDGRAEEWRRCDVPTNIVTSLFKSQGSGELPVLNGLVRQPYFRRTDGVLVCRSGYSETTGIYAAFDSDAFPLCPPTRDNALKALANLDALLVEFEFESETDRATANSAMLTATVRDSLKVAPAFNITASSPGSGKSYLASLFGPFAGPGEARNISYPGTNEEATKVVLSLALEQPAAVCFDDMPTDWLPHGALNRMLTNGTITERMLGSNKVITARAPSFVMGTGNNIRPLRDMARRVASIYLLPKTEAAATRNYAGKPAEEVRRNRGSYVADALTIISAWRAAGSPKADVLNIAGFEEWSDMCRHSLIWLGKPDPATSLIAQITHDPDSEQLGDLLEAWRSAFGIKPTLVRQVIKYIDDHKHDDLHAAVMELPCVERGYVNQSRFGRYLARNRNRIIRGLQLRDAPHSERKAWAVVPVTPQSANVVPPVDPVDPGEPIEVPERAWINLKEKHAARD